MGRSSEKAMLSMERGMDAHTGHTRRSKSNKAKRTKELVGKTTFRGARHKSKKLKLQ